MLSLDKPPACMATKPAEQGYKVGENIKLALQSCRSHMILHLRLWSLTKTRMSSLYRDDLSEALTEPGDIGVVRTVQKFRGKKGLFHTKDSYIQKLHTSIRERSSKGLTPDPATTLSSTLQTSATT